MAPVSPAAPLVRLRMYRQGLGDCFLLTFQGPRRPCHVLIDCGVVLGAADGEARIKQVAQNIRDETEGRLDLLIVTHEHWDHVSGFVQAPEVFKDFIIGEMWFAWTEDPDDALARDLRRRFEQGLTLIQRLHVRMTEQTQSSGFLGLRRRAEQMGELLGLYGTLGAAGQRTTAEGLRFLKEHPSKPQVRYLKPNDPVLSLPGAPAVRAFVLGPPHDEKKLRRINPTKRGQETYPKDDATRLALDESSLSTALAFLSPPQELEQDLQPFDSRWRIPVAEAKAQPFFDATYFAPPEDWRRIDGEQFGPASQLALDLDNYTNNTSLVLAFELEPGGRVLLFPGDAQVGNWASWAECHWPGTAAGQTIEGLDLLRRTVLYKVGHHGSHNATLRAQGLELMTRPELVAMLPVHHAQAVKKGWQEMPLESLMQRLTEKTQGRVLRIDDGMPACPSNVTPEAWENFVHRVTSNDLFIDYVIPD